MMRSPDKISRSKLLTLLCIASAVFGVVWIIMFLVLIAYSLKGNIPSGLFPGIVIEYLKAGYLFICAEIVLTAIGLAGVILMWQSRKLGFYLYAFTKAIIYFLPVIFIGGNHLTYPGLLVTTVFILFYGIIFSVSNKKSS